MVRAGTGADLGVPQVGVEEWRLGILGLAGIWNRDAGSGDCERALPSYCLGSHQKMENLPGYLDQPGPLSGLFLQSLGFDFQFGQHAYFQRVGS